MSGLNYDDIFVDYTARGIKFMMETIWRKKKDLAHTLYRLRRCIMCMFSNLCGSCTHKFYWRRTETTVIPESRSIEKKIIVSSSE